VIADVCSWPALLAAAALAVGHRAQSFRVDLPVDRVREIEIRLIADENGRDVPGIVASVDHIGFVGCVVPRAGNREVCVRDLLRIGQLQVIVFKDQDRAGVLSGLPARELRKFLFAGLTDALGARFL
jgi:hypothetical protein